MMINSNILREGNRTANATTPNIGARKAFAMSAAKAKSSTIKVKPSMSLVLLSENGNETIRVPFDSIHAAMIGSSQECAVVIPKRSNTSVAASIGLSEDGKTAILKQSGKSAATFLRAGDEFVLEGKTFRVEADENGPTTKPQSVKGLSVGAKKSMVTFIEDTTFALNSNRSTQAGTPTSYNQGIKGGLKLTANQLRNSTPHPKKDLMESIATKSDAWSVQTAAPATAMAQMESKQRAITEIKKQAKHMERILAHEKQMRMPLLDISTINRAYVQRDTIPASVRKFMTSRAKKPATKALRPFGEASVLSSSVKPASPLKVEIQKEGARLMSKRKELLKSLAEFDLEPEAYEHWTVVELEQRVWALEEEARRAGVEAILIESGHDPRDFVEYTADEIEDWLEREVIRKTAEMKRKNTSYQGTRISFGSPVSECSFAVYKDSEATAEHPEPDPVQPETKNEERENHLASPIMAPVEAAQAPKPSKIKVTMPQPDPMEMTCEQIRAELRKRDLKVSGLKSVIAERLAQAIAQEAEEEDFLTDGHPFLGQPVLREFEAGPSKGTVEAFLPAVDNNENSARFHILHEDGDTEVLDYEDTRVAIEAAKTAN